MASKNEFVIKAKTGLKTVKIMDETGKELLGSFRFNPLDSNLVQRADEVTVALRAIKIPDDTEDGQSDALREISQTISEKIDYLLGVKVSDTLFAKLGPLSVLESGELFYEFLLDQIGEIVNVVAAERLKTKMERVAAATAEYADTPTLAPLA